MRELLVTAKGRTWPVPTAMTAAVVLKKQAVTSPAITAFSAGAAPLYGMCSICTPAMVLSISPTKCKVLPVPGEP